MMDSFFGSQSLIITLDADNTLLDRVEELALGGFSIIEINRASPKTLQRLVLDYPSLRFGAGQLVQVEQLEEYSQSGAHFYTSPGFIPAMAQTAAIYSLFFLPGVATLSEAMQAINYDCTHVRPYPAKLPFCTLLNKCLPTLRLYPADIEWEEAEHFLSLPSVVAAGLLNPDIRQIKALVKTTQVA